jgi:hypothetical protein
MSFSFRFKKKQLPLRALLLLVPPLLLLVVQNLLLVQQEQVLPNLKTKQR